MISDRVNEIIGVLLLAFAILMLVSLLSFDFNDLSFFTSTPNSPVRNYIGIIGAYLAGIFIFLIGKPTSFLIPLLTFVWAFGKFIGKPPEKLYIKALGTTILFLAASSLFGALIKAPVAKFHNSGMLGIFVSNMLLRYFGAVGTYVILITFVVLSLLIATEFLLIPFVMSLLSSLNKLFLFAGDLSKKAKRPSKVQVNVAHASKPVIKKEIPRPSVPQPAPEKEKAIQIKTVVNEKKPKPALEKIPVARERKAATGDYKLPSLDLLDFAPAIAEREIKDDLENNARILEDTLADFGIEAKVAQIEQGPIITRYELEPAAGVKVGRIVNLTDDIALTMKAVSVRIIAPIPGKSRVGIEVPNSKATLVYLKELLECSEFTASKSPLTIALGKDTAGNPMFASLADMPHLLIAGATGSGKTVCVNSLIMSMLFNASPAEVKFVMVDPKMVEMAVFNGLPHLLCPVVTEPKKVSGALNWVVDEMERRYKLFAKLAVRNIDIYNQKVEASGFKNLPEDFDGVIEKLPYIVILIDELADLMMIAQDQIENAITRLAQLSRAVGIHIILATQRPSVDVITGVIKANFPARISFKVASKVDSRTVLDANGADKLIGKGDMLFLKPGTSKLIRGQSPLVSDHEIEKVVNFIKGQTQADYVTEILEQQERHNAVNTKFEDDELFDEAVKMILSTGQASVSMLQRRLGLGYTRAARLIDAMEDKGIVGPYQGSKPRDILVKKEDLGIKE